MAVGDNGTRYIPYKWRDQLLWKHLGLDLYSPSAALSQLVSNGLDAGCSRVDITIEYADPELGGPQKVIISDNGSGMTPESLEASFAVVGEHIEFGRLGRDVIGSRGIGRFAVFALSSESDWTTVAEIGVSRIRQSWKMDRELGIQVRSEPAPEMPTGTTVSFIPEDNDEVRKLFSTPHNVRWNLFNAFASYLLRYGDGTQFWVNGERVNPDEFVEHSETEDIGGEDGVPPAQLRHLLMGRQVSQPHTCMLHFSSNGATIKSQPLPDENVGYRKYLGLVDSPYLSELTNTGKSELASFDDRFRALECEATGRAKKFIERLREDRSRTFIERLRSEPYYPYKKISTVVDAVSRHTYETVMVALDEEVGLSGMPAKILRVLSLLTKQLLHSEDLATVLTSVLDLKGDHVSKLAELLRTTNLSSIIAAAELLVNRIQFLNELNELVYGPRASYVKERRHLHKLVERHTWLFGEQFNLMGSDTSINHLIPTLRAQVADVNDPEANVEDIPTEFRDIPDLYFMTTRWHQGEQYYQHLIVELKAPSQRIVPKHIDQLLRYADQIVSLPMFGQKDGSHKFTFVAVSAAVSDSVKRFRYDKKREHGFIGAPDGFVHDTELWALQWSDYIESRRKELNFLQEHIQTTVDPQDLQYLKKVAGDILPAEIFEVPTNGHDGTVPPAA